MRIFGPEADILLLGRNFRKRTLLHLSLSMFGIYEATSISKLGRCCSGPGLKGPSKGVRIFITKKKCKFGGSDPLRPQAMLGELFAGFVKQPFEVRSLGHEPAWQSLGPYGGFFGNHA